MAADGARGEARADRAPNAPPLEPGIEMDTRSPGADTTTTRHVQDPGNDAPTQPPTPTSKELLQERRTRAIETIFGLDKEAIPSWPGLQVVCAHIERCFDVVPGDKFKQPWENSEARPKESYEIWDWYLTFSHKSGYEESYLDIEKFAALCCASLVLKPIRLGIESVGFENYVRGYEVLIVYRGLDEKHNLFNHIRNSFQVASVTDFDDHPEDQSRDVERAGIHGGAGMIYENTVNFDSLSTIGRLTIRWVDSIANHLVFDQEKHVVCVFRFPTFSAAMIKGNSLFSAGEHWTQLALVPRSRGLNLALHFVIHDYKRLHREVLLTYRLLFGQSPRSRKLAKDSLAREKSARLESGQDDIDPLLDELCTVPLSTSWITRILSPRKQLQLSAKLFPPSCTNGQNDKFTESASYTVKHDFPVFGARLLALQEYNERQKPTRARDLWRDRRNPLQWYTFWAVIWVGSISIILGTLQLGVSIAQLYYAPGSSKNS